jgi:ubiquinone/menaquinone biosynthesis C-methylase UbiE
MEVKNQLTDSIFRALYNGHKEYKEIRAEGSLTHDKYIDDVKYWKLRYMEKLLFKTGCINEITSVCEIGCSTGVLLSNFLPSKVQSKIGIDISDENISYAKNKFPNVHFFRGTFDDYLNSNDRTPPFDLIIMSDILEHVESDVELLKKAGENSRYVVINLPIEKVPEYKDRVYGIDDVEGHLRAYSVEDALKMCEKAGMNIIKYYIKQYVKQPSFRKYLFNKMMDKYNDKVEALVQYQTELLDIDLDPEYYKKNFYALLESKNY